MHQFGWLLATALCGVGVANAQVYRCEDGGKVTYSDAPCRKGHTAREVEVQPNSVQALRAPVGQPAGMAAHELPPPRGHQRGPAGGAAPGACPSATDIGNIHTRLSARVVPARNRVALQQELAKAQRCIELGTKYSYDDWKRLEAVLRGDD